MPKLTARQTQYAEERLDELYQQASTELHDLFCTPRVFPDWDDLWDAVDDGVLPEPTVAHLRAATLEPGESSAVRLLAIQLVGDARAETLWPTETRWSPEGISKKRDLERALVAAKDDLILGTDGLFALDKFAAVIKDIILS